MKLAVFLPNWVGDVVMATPALLALREHFAGAAILGVQRRYVAEVLSGTHLLDDTILVSPGGFSRGPRGQSGQESLGNVALIRRLRRENVDRAILFTNSFRTALLAWAGGCRERIGYARDGRNWLLTHALEPIRDGSRRLKPSPIIDAYNLLAVAAGTPAPQRRMILATTPQDEQQADVVWRKFDLNIHRPIIVLNPAAAYGSAKLWPAHHFARLARLLVDKLDAQILVLGGPHHGDLTQIIVQQADRNDVHSLAGEPLSLGLTKACIHRADLLITTDSGPRHFAAAFDRPVVTLFGPTHIAWTETYFDKAVHLQHRLPCGPCQKRVCPLHGRHHHRCMLDLLPEEVFVAARGLLGRRLPLPLLFPQPQEQRRAS